jgi:signal transduction histidine kinase
MQLNRSRSFLAALKPTLLFGVALSVVIGYMAFYFVSRTIESENDERFHNMARTAQYTINARIRSYTNVLRALASYFAAEPGVTRDSFHRFYVTLGLEENYPAIETINFVGWVTDEQRLAFEAKVRGELKLTHLDGRQFDITPPGRRPVYAPVLFVEPQAQWDHMLGYDLNWLPIALKSLQKARDTGEISASGLALPMMKKKKRLGLAMRLPVYKSDVPLNNVEQRRAAYIGSIGIAFGVKKLVNGVLDELPLKTVSLALYNHVQVPDPAAANPAQLIYDSSSTEENPTRPELQDDQPRYHVWVPIDFNGREWNAHFSTPKAEVNRYSDTSFPWLAALAGFTTTMLLYGGFYTLTSSRARAIELAKGMTSELLASQEQLLLSHQKLRQLAAHGEHIKEIERKRIAREIHDDLGQNLLALRLDAQMLFSRTNERHHRLHMRAEATLGQIDATIKSVRQIINDLRPNVLDLGLNAAVAWQIAEFQRRTGIKCDLVEYDKEIAVDDNCAIALFRILQESLTNVSRHAMANWVRVDLRVEAGNVLMSIRDNGIGLQASLHNKPGGFGLIGIEERVSMLDGKFSLSNAQGGGTLIEVAVPQQQQNSPHEDLRELHDREQENELV